MNRHLSIKGPPAISNLAHPLGTVIFCVHCFKTLGTESRETSREFLVAHHACLEGMQVKLPAAPPPYN
jgi:hypothetical protein